MVYFALGKIVNLIGQIFMILDNLSLLLLGQYLKDNLAIWSHWQVPSGRATSVTVESSLMRVNASLQNLFIVT